MNREEIRYFGLCHDGAAHILVSIYHVKRVAILEFLRRLSTGRYQSGGGRGVRPNMFIYPLQKMEVIFRSGEITVVRHLVDANPHVHAP